MSDRKPSQPGEAHEPAEHDKTRQPRIDPSKPLRDRIYGREWATGGAMIFIAVAFVAGGLKLAGVW